MPTLADLQTRQQTLIRKALDASVFVRDYDTTDPIIAITDATGLLALPTGYEDVGMLTKDDGATWTRDIEASDTTSWGFSEPTRRDIISDVSGLQFTMQESKRVTLELHHGLSLSSTTYSGTTGEISFDKPSRPAMRYLSILALAKDGDGADTIYFARWLPRASVTDMAEQTWQEGEETRYGVTLTAYVDPATGTSMREFWGGPALLAGLAADMGFTAAGA